MIRIHANRKAAMSNDLIADIVSGGIPACVFLWAWTLEVRMSYRLNSAELENDNDEILSLLKHSGTTGIDDPDIEGYARGSIADSPFH
jgi:hypothetical protein